MLSDNQIQKLYTWIAIEIAQKLGVGNAAFTFVDIRHDIARKVVEVRVNIGKNSKWTVEVEADEFRKIIGAP